MRTLLLSAVRACTALALAALFSTAARAGEPPLITLVYPEPSGSVFDRTCTARFGVAVEQRWVQETLRRRVELQERWDREGPAYLRAVLDAVGAPFPYAEMQATLTVCTEESLAMPLMVNTRSFLSDAKIPEDIRMWPRLVFHELMHTYTEPVNARSELQRKYAGDGVRVTNHLHVVAMEKFVLTKLGRTDELALLDKDYRQIAPAAYRRAWEIVGIEGVDAFIAELRVHLPKQSEAARRAAGAAL